MIEKEWIDDEGWTQEILEAMMIVIQLWEEKMVLLELQTLLENWTKDRPTLKENNTPQQILLLLQNEVTEASESLTDTENLASEISDVIILALTLANQYGFNMDQEIREKIAVNTIRYQARYFQDGDYHESRKYVKSIEKPILEEFYNIPR